MSVVTWSNRFDRPVFPKELTRMEVDPLEAGETVASAVASYLETGVFPENQSFGPKWYEGETISSTQRSKV